MAQLNLINSRAQKFSKSLGIEKKTFEQKNRCHCFDSFIATKSTNQAILMVIFSNGIFVP